VFITLARTVVLFSAVSVCDCSFVNTVTPEPLEMSSRNVTSVHHPVLVKRQAKIENGYCGVRGRLFKVNDDINLISNVA